jgi:hypothetical protein
MMEDLLSNEGEAPPPAEEQEQRMAITLRGKDGKDVHLRAKPVNNDAVCVCVCVSIY